MRRMAGFISQGKITLQRKEIRGVSEEECKDRMVNTKAV